MCICVLEAMSQLSMNDRHNLDETCSYFDLYSVPQLCVSVANGGASVPVKAQAKPGKRLSLQVSGDLHRQLKVWAMEEDETMNSLIVKMLRRHLREREQMFERLR